MGHPKTARKPALRRALPLFAVIASSLLLTGCATAVVGSVTLGQISAAAGIASVSTTGKGLQDHALSAVTGQDCRLVEGIFRRNRRICEEPGSPATENDFPGVVVMLMGPRDEEPAPEAEPQVIYAGLVSDFRPSLARSERRARAEEMPVPMQMAAIVPSQPMLRPGSYSATYGARIVQASFGPALSRTVRRGPEREAVVAMEEAGEMPTLREWAGTQPAPTITAVRLTSE